LNSLTYCIKNENFYKNTLFSHLVTNIIEHYKGVKIDKRQSLNINDELRAEVHEVAFIIIAVAIEEELIHIETNQTEIIFKTKKSPGLIFSLNKDILNLLNKYIYLCYIKLPMLIEPQE